MTGRPPLDPSPQVPRLSVVIPSVNGPDDLFGCLDAVLAEAQHVVLEVLVVDRLGTAVRERIARQYPQVRILAAPETASIPDLRAMAFDVARGDIVAVIEDHVIVPVGWAAGHLDAHAGGGGKDAVVGGSVENLAVERLVDRAAFLCEYHHLLPPLPVGEVEGLTGNNTSYPRRLLLSYRETYAAGRWENVLHDAMRRDGVILRSCPALRVGHKMHYTVRAYCAQRYLYSRAYSGARFATMALSKRLVLGVATLALPPILLARIIGTVRGKAASYRRDLMPSLPLLALFTIAWALGDAVGALRGPGDALRRVR